MTFFVQKFKVYKKAKWEDGESDNRIKAVEFQCIKRKFQKKRLVLW